jgi:hypothetical protein
MKLRVTGRVHDPSLQEAGGRVFMGIECLGAVLDHEPTEVTLYI